MNPTFANLLFVVILVLLPVDIAAKPNLDVCLTKSDNQNTKKLELFHRHCLEIELPYNTVTLPEYGPKFNFTSSDEVVDYLKNWQGVKILPKCWPFLQVALCSILMPQLDDQSRLHKPSVDICNDLVNKNNCKFIERHHGWPRIFNCSDTNIYARNCTNELRDLRPKPSQDICQYPLVPTSDSTQMFKDVKGCALHCKYPILNQHDQHYISIFIRIICSIGLIATFIVMVLYEIAESGKSTLAKVFQRCNLCKLISYIGWSLQILFINSDLACTPNGSALRGLPLVANACVLTFFLTYMSSLTYSFWYAYLGRLCHDSLKESQHSAKQPKLRFNLLNIIVPSIMFVIIAFLGHIDGHGLRGICTVSHESIIVKMLLDYGPTLIATLYGNYYFTVTVLETYVFSRKENIKPTSHIKHMMCLAIFTSMQLLTSILSFAYVHRNNPKWTESIDNYIACKLDLQQLYDSASVHQDCATIDTQPMVALEYLELFSTLASGLVVASWAYSDLILRAPRIKPNQLFDSRGCGLSQDVAGSALSLSTMSEHAPGMKERPKARRRNSIASSLKSKTLSIIGSYSEYRRDFFASARDVVNDQRNNIQATNLLNPPMTNQLNLPLGQLPINMMDMAAIFNAVNTIRVEDQVHPTPQFDFGICEKTS